MPPLNEERLPSPAPIISLGDIYYVLFRHKWKIVLISFGGLALAITLALTGKPTYQSEAKLFIRYVLESKAPGQIGEGESRVRSPDRGGETVINTELEILTSVDLAQQVAQIIGPEKILAKVGGETNLPRAVNLLRKNLTVEVPARSSVVRIVFRHPDPEILQPVLTQLIDSYLKKHAEIHMTGGILNDLLIQETDQLRSRLVQTEDALRKAERNVGVVSIEDAKRNYATQMARLREEIGNAEAELAERQAVVSTQAKLLNLRTGAATNQAAATNLAVATNLVATTNLMALTNVAGLTTQSAPTNLAARTAVAVSTNQAAPSLPAATTSDAARTNAVAVSAEIIAKHRRLAGFLSSLELREQELSLQFTGENTRLQNVREQIAKAESQLRQLEAEHPGLTARNNPEPNAPEARAVEPQGADPLLRQRTDLIAEMTRVTGLESRLRVLTNQFEQIRKQAMTLDDVEGSITELQRKKELEESHYKYFAANREQARIDEALGTDRVSNISKIQAPSAPLLDPSKLSKIAAGIFFVSVGFAVGLAFLLEFYLDRSLKRPVEIEARLGLPLFVAIPWLKRNGKPRRLKAANEKPLLPQGAAEAGGNGAEATRAVDGANVVLADQPPELRPFYDALRDRLITYFEVKKLTHKPKLVAVTSCAEGSGVSTVTAGLAASLSETGDGNVLLVDLNQEQGAIHRFFQGNLQCGLDEALELGKRDSALVGKNLYVVSDAAHGEQLPRVLPKRFTNLVPRLKASDYDYILFDMPPISQISVTPRLAGFMDMVLLVVESEKTDREVVSRATAWLAESQGNVSVVLNKGRTYVPRFLQQEL